MSLICFLFKQKPIGISSRVDSYEARKPIGLEGVLRDVFPIEDSHKIILEYKNYYLENLNIILTNVWIE